MRKRRLEKTQGGEWGKNVGFGGILAEEVDGFDAGGVEGVVDVVPEVMADGVGRERDAGGPLVDEVFDVREAVVAGTGEVFGELGGGDVAGGEGFGTDGPDGGDPREVGAGVPFVGEVEPLAGAYGLFDVGTGFEREEGGVADEDGRVGSLEHRDGVGRGGEEGGVGVEEFAEEDFGVREGTAGCGVSSDGFYGAEGVGFFDDKLNGADVVERGDDAVGDDGEVRGEGSDGDEAEIGAVGEEFIGAARRESVVEAVVLGQGGGKRWVLEVPHEGSGVEEVDRCDSEHGW